MSNHLTYTLNEIIDELDGNGLIVTDYLTIQEALHDMGFSLETTLQTEELED